MSGKVGHRIGTTAQWAAANPVLLDGEVGLDRDTRQRRLGDGVTQWSALPDLPDAAALSALDGRVADTEGDVVSLDSRVVDLESAAAAPDAVPYVVAGVGAPATLASLADVVATGTGDATVLQDAVTLARTSGRPLWLAGGTFDLDAAVSLAPGSRGSVAHGLTIHAVAPTRIELADSYKPFYIAGYSSQSHAQVTSNVAAGATSVTVDAVGSLAVGDWAVLRSDENYDSDRLTQSRRGEWVRIAAIPNSTTLTLEWPTRDSYLSATAVVDLHELASDVVLTGPVTVVGVGPASTQQSARQVWLEGTLDAYVDGWHIENATDAGLCVANSVRPRIGRHLTVDAGSADESVGYGIKLEGVLDAVLDVVAGQRTRHTFDVNGGNTIGSRRRPITDGVQVRRVTADNDLSSGFGIHPSCLNVTVDEVVVRHSGGGAMLRGSDVTIGRLSVRSHDGTDDAYDAAIIVGDNGSDADGTSDYAGKRVAVLDGRGIDLAPGSLLADVPVDAIKCHATLADAVFGSVGPISTRGATGIWLVDDRGRGPSDTMVNDRKQGRSNGANVGQVLDTSTPAAAFTANGSGELTVDGAGSNALSSLSVDATADLAAYKRWTMTVELTTAGTAAGASRAGVLVSGGGTTDALIGEVYVQSSGATSVRLTGRGTMSGVSQTNSIGTVTAGSKVFHIELQRDGDRVRVLAGRAGRLTDVGAWVTLDAAQLAALDALTHVGLWANLANSDGTDRFGHYAWHRFP